MSARNPVTTTVRITLRHDDIAGQRRWLDAVRAETYTGAPRQMPRVVRPKPPKPPGSLSLFACLPEAKRPPKPTELSIAKARPAEPVPDNFTPEELFHIESFFARSSLDAAAVRRWDAWVADGRTATRQILRVPDLDGSVDIETLETRLGWGARVHFGNRRDHVARGNPIRPDYSGGVDWFFWQTRDAAIAYCANKIWASALDTRGYGDRKRRQWELFAGEMQAFCARVGIDVTVPPPASMKRVVITDARERELKAGAPPAPAPPPAALTPAEIAEVEAYALHGDTYGPVGDAARDRWNDWISEGAIGETFAVKLTGKRDRAVVEVVQTKLGWMLRCHYEYPDKGGGFGSGLLPLRDTLGRYFWADRKAAIQAGAYSAWSSAVHPTPGQTAEARARIGERILAHFKSLGVDATVEPSRDRRRRLITEERIRQLQAAAVAPPVATADDPPGVNLPIRRLLQRAGVIQPLSPLAMKRRRLKAQRQEAAAAAKAAAKVPSVEDLAFVAAAVRESLPEGCPSYVQEVLRVRHVPGRVVVVMLRLFDGHLGRLKIYGDPGEHGYSWKPGSRDRRPFEFDEDSQSWVRVSEPEH